MLANPRLAGQLYVAILVVAVMFSKTWGPIREYLSDATKTAREKASAS